MSVNLRTQNCYGNRCWWLLGHIINANQTDSAMGSPPGSVFLTVLQQAHESTFENTLSEADPELAAGRCGAEEFRFAEEYLMPQFCLQIF